MAGSAYSLLTATLWFLLFNEAFVDGVNVHASFRRTGSKIKQVPGAAPAYASGNLNAASQSPLADWLPQDKQLWICIRTLQLVQQHAMPVNTGGAQTYCQHAKEALMTQLQPAQFDGNAAMTKNCQDFGNNALTATQNGQLSMPNADSRDMYCNSAVGTYPFKPYQAPAPAPPVATTTQHPDVGWQDKLMAMRNR
eukprot:gnl/TRDRNA2_/TRDRNA2_41936_c0_seq1.p2 gnl/TRDRNA2_/TRDRNA2_41936_c0~~gnl/TRDRNA2_/TRDRNA2_41936_c0_seq1.p2  ORF type:complete len:195 (+),score=31.62 gnl/TRDRNA2_/TRDRNA2_41936_c0_seq1:57-641(+)